MAVAMRMFLKRELAKVGDDDICTVRPEVDGVVASSDANHEPEPAGTSRFHADEGIFEDDGASRWRLEPPGRFQEHVRRRLAWKTEPSKIDAVYADVKELAEACRAEHRRTVLRR
jgi:hypothetical protein